jgi:hypothetical protein
MLDSGDQCESVFLYNSELWTLTKQLEKEIDIFQRKIIRRAFNIKWFDKISNEDLYKKYHLQPWSEKIQQRRLRWYGHLIRLEEDIPAKKALREAERKVKKYPGGQKLTWMKQLEKDLKEFKIQPEKVEKLAQNRQQWRQLIARRMLTPDGGNC